MRSTERYKERVMKYTDQFETKVEACAYDKWLNIDIDGMFILDGKDKTTSGGLSIDIPKDKALELAKIITEHFAE